MEGAFVVDQKSRKRTRSGRVALILSLIAIVVVAVLLFMGGNLRTI